MKGELSDSRSGTKEVVFVGRRNIRGLNLKRSFGRLDVARGVVEPAAKELRDGWDQLQQK
jgi:hypothetical protein